jgi:signal transduction histidine kinase
MSRIKLFTPRARDIFNVIPSDRGRPLSDISHQLPEFDLQGDIQRVLERLERVSREVSTRDGKWYLMQIVPYRTVEDHIDGVVLTFLDITDRRRAEENVRVVNDELERRVQQRTLQLITVQEDERRRIARDLHDQVGQQLTALSLKLEALHARAEPSQKTALQELQDALARLDREIDFLTWELRPAALDELGLANALGTFVREWSKNYGIAGEFHASGMEDRPPLEFAVETNVYRIALEALNNAQKHGKPKRVAVILERRDNELALIVEDDGQGFNLASHADNDSREKTLGVIGMRERAAVH